MTPFAILLRTLRLTRGLRQFELAKLLGVTAAYLSFVECGHESPPGADFISQVASILQLSADELKQLDVAAARSQRRFSLEGRVPTHQIELFNVLSEQLPKMSLEHARRVRAVIDASEEGGFANDGQLLRDGQEIRHAPRSTTR